MTTKTSTDYLPTPLAESSYCRFTEGIVSPHVTITVYTLDECDARFEPAAVWSHADNFDYAPYGAALRLLRADRGTSSSELAVIQALLSQDRFGHWTGLPSEDKDDYATPLSSENITRCLHMHAHTTFDRRDMIASCLVVLRLMDMGLTVHIHSDWAKLLVKQVLLEVLTVATARSATQPAAISDYVKRIRAWTGMPRGFDTWADKAAARMIRDPYSVLPHRGFITFLGQRNPRPVARKYGIDDADILGYLTHLISLS